MVSTLQLKHSGDYVTADEWNELILRLQSVTSTSTGFDDGLAQGVQTDVGWSEPSFTGRWVGTGDLLPYSIGQLEEAQSLVVNFIEPVVQNVIDFIGSPVLITNGGTKVSNGETFTAVRIGQFFTKVRYDITDVPEVGKECGPNNTTGHVSKLRTGLLCLSKPDATETFVYVYGLGGKSEAATIHLGRLSGDVVSGGEVTVPIFNENLSAVVGDSLSNVKNNTGVTLKGDTVVYIFEMVNWPYVDTARYSMFPAQLQDCGVAKTISP